MPLLSHMRDRLDSPYLLAHVDNPVQWWAWGHDALDQARERQVPIFLSIGYAACHWCHVMAHESFEDASIAGILNDSFVSIKVDREERPDLDALYMSATQLITGQGGWPMSVFLLPDGRPFLAGTYYPPEDRHGQVGFARLLRAVTNAWQVQRAAVIAQADELEGAIVREVSFVDHLAPPSSGLALDKVRHSLREDLLARADEDEGGFGGAPKFPRPSYVEALLEFDDPEAHRSVTQTLDAMSRRGLYDHIGGGFARYSVDDEWHVPHFEKMLSDQALLASTYLRASSRLGQPQWREVALDTLAFVVRELKVGSGFAASLDADAGGVEGAHVTWNVDEVASALEADGCGGDLARVLARWRITSPGLFEGRSIPRLALNELFSTPNELHAALAALRRARATRVQPARDDKVILEWNAMFAHACLASGETPLRDEALGLLASLRTTHFDGANWWRTSAREAHATASDVAWMLDADLDAFESTGEDSWLVDARGLASYLIAHYWDGEVPTSRSPEAGGGIFAQSDLSDDLFARPKDLFDAATPASHSVACRAIARLAIIEADNDLLAVAQRLVAVASSLLETHPAAVPDLVAAAGFALEGRAVVIPGAANHLSDHLRLNAVARSVLITGLNSSPLLEGRVEGLAYVCRSGVCQLPVDTIEALDQQLLDAQH